MAAWSDPSGRLEHIERLVRTIPIALAGADARRRVRFWNPAFEQLFLYKAEDIAGKTFEALVQLRDDKDAAAAVRRLARGEHVRFTTRARRRDRTLIDIEFHGVPDAVNGRFAGYWGVFHDITERRSREHALQVSAETFSKAFLITPSTAAVSASPDHRLIDVNNTWVRLTGYRREEAIGRTLLELGLLDEAAIREINERLEARGGRLRDFECRLRMRDGTVRIGSLSVEEFVVEGEALRMTLVADITALRNAEASVSRISQLLLENHERERVRIAHELHDDIGQRIAVWQLSVDRLIRDLRGADPVPRAQLVELRTQASGVAAGVQALTRDLHFAPLGIIPIDVALERLCAQTSERLDMDIGFTRRDVSGALPTDVSLCLFRVAEDALTHIAKHGASRRADIELRGTPGSIHLSVREYGNALSVDDGHAAQLAMIAMRERVAGVKGTFSIMWNGEGGTEVRVAIPLADPAATAP